MLNYSESDRAFVTDLKIGISSVSCKVDTGSSFTIIKRDALKGSNIKLFNSYKSFGSIIDTDITAQLACYNNIKIFNSIKDTFWFYVTDLPVADNLIGIELIASHELVLWPDKGPRITVSSFNKEVYKRLVIDGIHGTTNEQHVIELIKNSG